MADTVGLVLFAKGEASDRFGQHEPVDGRSNPRLTRGFASVVLEAMNRCINAYDDALPFITDIVNGSRDRFNADVKRWAASLGALPLVELFADPDDEFTEDQCAIFWDANERMAIAINDAHIPQQAGTAVKAFQEAVSEAPELIRGYVSGFVEFGVGAGAAIVAGAAGGAASGLDAGFGFDITTGVLMVAAVAAAGAIVYFVATRKKGDG